MAQAEDPPPSPSPFGPPAPSGPRPSSPPPSSSPRGRVRFDGLAELDHPSQSEVQDGDDADRRIGQAPARLDHPIADAAHPHDRAPGQTLSSNRSMDARSIGTAADDHRRPTLPPPPPPPAGPSTFPARSTVAADGQHAVQRPEMPHIDSLDSLESDSTDAPFPPLQPPSSHWPGGPSSVTMAPPAVASPASTPSPRGLMPTPVLLPPQRSRSPPHRAPSSLIEGPHHPLRRPTLIQRSSSLSGPIAGPSRPPPEIGRGRVDPDAHWLSEDEGERQDREGLSGPGGWRAPKSHRWEWEGEAYRADKASRRRSNHGAKRSGSEPLEQVAAPVPAADPPLAREASPPPLRPLAVQAPHPHLTGASVPTLVPTRAFSRPPSSAGGSQKGGNAPALAGDPAPVPPPLMSMTEVATEDPAPPRLPTPPQPLPSLDTTVAKLFDVLKCSTPERHPPSKSSRVRTAQAQVETSPLDSLSTATVAAALLEDPVTLGCGHTFCAECLGFSGQRRHGSTRTGAGHVRTVARPPSASAREEPSTPVSGGNGPLSGLMGIVRRASSGSPPAPQHAPTSGGLFPSTASGSPAGSKVVCPVSTCESRQKGTGAVTDEMAVDVGLQKILMLVRREWPSLWDTNKSLPPTSATDTTVGAPAGTTKQEFDEKAALDSSERSASSTGDDPDENAKRGHKLRSWATSKRTKRVEDVVDAYPVGGLADLGVDPAAAEKATLAADWSDPKSVDLDLATLVGGPGQHATLVQDLLSELECQVCTLLFFEPVTTPCGHTFCKNCLLRSLDHSDKCPLCRADFPGFAFFQEHPINHAINRLLVELFSELYLERKAVSEELVDSSLNTPLFVCTLAFPSIPTFLHVFEPRYRLMMRRAMERDRRFGMVLPSRNNGGVHEYGTMLEIRNMQLLQDGRSMVETMGVGRFKVLEHGTLDGYTVGRIQVIEDITPEQEAELERAALRSAGQSEGGQGPEVSTEELMRTCREFVEVLRSGSTPWILQRLNNTFGPMPSNPTDFSYWMAMILPMAEEQKALLIPITSSRLRLRLIVHWIETFRSQWWFRGALGVRDPLGPLLFLLGVIVIFAAYRLRFVDWHRLVLELGDF